MFYTPANYYFPGKVARYIFIDTRSGNIVQISKLSCCQYLTSVSAMRSCTQGNKNDVSKIEYATTSFSQCWMLQTCKLRIA